MIYFTLFFEFAKIGLFALGGGLATLPFLYQLSDKYHWFDAGMLSNMIAVSESTPGPIGVNMATYAGFLSSGILGGVIATIGLVTPSVIIIIIVAKFLSSFKENAYVQNAFYGLRPAVTALIALSGYEVTKTSLFSLDTFSATRQIASLFNVKACILFIIFFVLINKLKLHPIIFIILGGIIGVLLNM